MITEITINGVASYKAPSTIKPTNKTCLFYGLNGAGKSTISSFLYNPANPDYSKCEIKKNHDCELLVYNQDFLNEYFYEDDNLKGIFTLSKENKNVLQKIEEQSKELESLIEKKTTTEKDYSDLTEKAEQEKSKASSKIWEIKTKYSGGDRVLEFCLEKLKRTELLFDHISSLPLPPSKPDYNIDQLKHETSLIQGDGAIHINKLSTITAEWEEIEKNPIFGKIIVGSKEGSVAEFISGIGNSDWVQTGLQYIRHPSPGNATQCPFCQENTLTEEIINSIKDVFDEAYANDVSEIEKLKDKYAKYADSLELKDISELPITSSELSGAWKQAADLLQSTFRENSLLIDKKLKNPSISIILNSSETAVKELNTISESLNKLIDIHNDKLNNKKRSTEEIKEKFWSLMRWDYDQTISSYNTSKHDIDEKLKETSEKIKIAFEDITKTTNNISELRKQTVNIEESIQNINNSLIEIGITEFSVIKHSENLYRIARAGAQSNAFRSLSEGEKTVISFLYFIELCKGQKSASAVPKKKTVVIDDPISSLSHIYVFNISQLIKKHFINSSTYEQVIILTHSLYFFYELTFTKKEDRDQKQHLFRIFKNASGSNIQPMKYEEIQNDYQSYWSIIKDDATPPALIANCMRNIIEYFFNFVQKNDFNKVFQKPALKSDKFAAFYRYMNRESHSLGQNIFDIKEFDYEVFKDGLKLVFEECGYGDHYKAMTK